MSPESLTQYGVLGIFSALMIVVIQQLLRREKERSDRENSRSDKAEAEVARLNTLIQEKIFPLINSSTNAIEGATIVLAKLQRRQEMEDYYRRRKDGDGVDK